MENLYRCLRCGNNLSFLPEDDIKCNTCAVETEMVMYIEGEGDRLPFPTDPIGRKDPAIKCQCRAGTCPCGAFVAHKVTEPCNSHEFPQIEKED